mmetsp:Transcript_13516/g.53601  ORF Transcript_13516/g.53601 Transcript_13516/m.53601 type:complete len:126 (+) Transcript_13516:154-531(+)
MVRKTKTKKEAVEEPSTLRNPSFKSAEFKARKNGRGRKWRTLKQIVSFENYDLRPVGTVHYASIQAAPSVKPVKKYCDVSGLPAPYVDPKTRLRFHNAYVFAFIRQLTLDQVQQYLALRQAANKI